MAKRKEKEENSKAGRVILPELPQQQAGMMQATRCRGPRYGSINRAAFFWLGWH